VRIVYRSSSSAQGSGCEGCMIVQRSVDCPVASEVGWELSWHQHVYCLAYDPKTIMFLVSFSNCYVSSWCRSSLNELFQIKN